MRRFQLGYWAIALLLFPISLIAQVDWLPLRIDDIKRPVIYFPLPFDQIQDTIPTPLGAMPFTTYYAKDDDGESGNRLYMMTIIDYPEGSFPADSTARIEDFFESTITAAAESVGGEILISQQLEGQGYPSYLFRIDYGEERPTVVRNRAYLIGDRYYHQQVFSFKVDDGSRSRKRFFENFYPPLKS